jgi:dolichyl-phosphate-mannose--protein O-mannosyl transferase
MEIKISKTRRFIGLWKILSEIQVSYVYTLNVMDLTLHCHWQDVPDIVHPPPKQPKQVKKMNFFKKFFELQFLALAHNAGLTDSHPYASTPINWPFLLSGISFWTGKEGDREQMYMVGNVAGWWTCVMTLSVFVGIVGADLLSRQRGDSPIPDGEWSYQGDP